MIAVACNDVVGVTEIAERAGVKANTVHKWRHRYVTFPRPFAELAQGPVWDWAKVEAWMAARQS